MSAERHALLAALEYSERQSQEIQRLTQNAAMLRQEARDIRRQLREVREALDGRDKQPGEDADPRPQAYADMTMQHTPLAHKPDESNPF